MKGKSRSSASMRPSVDLPAPRNPIRATRKERGLASLRGSVPKSSPTATLTRRRVASSRLSSISRKRSHSGDRVVTSPRSSVKEHCSARVTCNRTRIEALPTPYSRLARCRSDTSVACASALRVMPRRARKDRTRSPSAIRNGSLSRPAATVERSGRGSLWTPSSAGSIVLDIGGPRPCSLKQDNALRQRSASPRARPATRRPSQRPLRRASQGRIGNSPLHSSPRERSAYRFSLVAVPSIPLADLPE